VAVHIFNREPSRAYQLKFIIISVTLQIGRHLACITHEKGIGLALTTVSFPLDIKDRQINSSSEGKTMIDSMKRRELLRLSVRWPLTIKTESGEAHGETRNITGEGMFLYCSERLLEGVVYSMTIKLPEKLLEVTGQLTWSNLDNCTSLNFNPAMGFYFVRIDEDKDRQSFREAIASECEKPLRMRREADRHTNSPFSSEAQATPRSDGIARNTQIPRN
jgi:hypothetical protein